MNYDLKRVYQVYEASEKIYFDSLSSYVLMSDCHRGTGSLNDDFYKNKDIYLQALNYYYNKEYVYIEIGDGDELWENDSFQEIINTHKDSFDNLSRFNRQSRLYLIYGNHDVVKRD
jgi:UDP-2,3-diacylglucosamine pyrophosphatase LpxH